MYEKSIWVASDGKEFATKEECISYEKLNCIPLKVRKAIHALRTYCQTRDCSECPLNDREKKDCSLLTLPINWESIESQLFQLLLLRCAVTLDLIGVGQDGTAQ